MIKKLVLVAATLGFGGSAVPSFATDADTGAEMDATLLDQGSDEVATDMDAPRRVFLGCVQNRLDCARLARAHGLRGHFVSYGFQCRRHRPLACYAMRHHD